MIVAIDKAQLAWFKSWIESHDSIPSDHFPRWIAILHPGTYFATGRKFPFHLKTSEEGRDAHPSLEQKRALDRILLESQSPHTACSFALYAGYMDPLRQGSDSGFNEPTAEWYSGRLNYVLLAGELADCTFAAVTARWSSVTFTELSYLWADDHSWFLSSTADTSVTVIGCGDEIASSLLAEPGLKAHEWAR